MFARAVRKFALILALSLGMTVAAHAEPALHEVYEAARTGHLNEARQMMRQVLANHPGSAKAHYVAAEIDARSGDVPGAAKELMAAERLDPGLSFAKPESVAALRRELAGTRSEARPRAFGAGLPAIPWGALFLVAALIGVAWWATRRRAAAAAAPGAPFGALTPGAGPLPAGPMGYGGVAAPPAGGGLLGSLATGMAVGAGVVAGEELVRHVLEPRHPANAEPWSAPAGPEFTENPDMGGSDFGISDAGSWDSGGADDWS